jgi:DNA-binding transcriptional LysR family regulator
LPNWIKSIKLILFWKSHIWEFSNTETSTHLNIQYFHEFIELARLLNFRETAKQLNMSQSALSKHISALEQDYNAPIFIRDKNQIYLTSEGALLLEDAQKIWTTYEMSKETLRSTINNAPLVIAGIVESPDEHRAVSQIMRYVNDHGIKRRVCIKTAGNLLTDKQFDALRKHDYSCFISYNLDACDHGDDIDLHHICSVPLDVVMSSSNFLAKRKSVKLADLSGGIFIHLSGPKFTPTWHAIDQILNNKGVAHTSRPILTDSVYDYLNIDLGNSFLVLPQNRHGFASMDNPYAKCLEVHDKDFKLELFAAYLKSSLDDSLQCLLDGLTDTYCGIYSKINTDKK